MQGPLSCEKAQSCEVDGGCLSFGCESQLHILLSLPCFLHVTQVLVPRELSTSTQNLDPAAEPSYSQRSQEPSKSVMDNGDPQGIQKMLKVRCQPLEGALMSKLWASLVPLL